MKTFNIKSQIIANTFLGAVKPVVAVGVAALSVFTAFAPQAAQAQEWRRSPLAVALKAWCD
jgi:hypothetical protein